MHEPHPHLKGNFAAAVNENPSFCKEQGKEPAQPFSGTFNVRTGVDLHRRAALYAEAHSEKLKNVVKQALESFLEHAA